MKSKIKLFIFPILTVVLLMILAVTFLQGNKNAKQVDGENGVIYTDCFTGNAASNEWKTNWDKKISAPEVVRDSLHFSGSGVKPSAAMLGVELPKTFDMFLSVIQACFSVWKKTMSNVIRLCFLKKRYE